MFIYKCKVQITGYAMRRERWMELAYEFPEMALEVKRYIFKNYDEEIRKPLLEYKCQDFSVLEGRADYTNVVAI
jgi:hypothetical protein